MLVLGLGFLFLMRKLFSDESFLIGPTDPGEIFSRKIYMLSQPVGGGLLLFQTFFVSGQPQHRPGHPGYQNYFGCAVFSGDPGDTGNWHRQLSLLKPRRLFLFCCGWFFIVLITLVLHRDACRTWPPSTVCIWLP